MVCEPQLMLWAAKWLGGEYEIGIEGKTAPEIVGLITATLGSIS